MEIPASVQNVIDLARHQLKPTGIILFGSRARGTASPTSDFDLALKGIEDTIAWNKFYNYVQHEAPTQKVVARLTCPG